MADLDVLVLAFVTTSDASLPASTGQDEDSEEERHRLTTLSGLAALSLDALSSVAYGPEAIVIVLVAAGTVGLGYTLPVTLAIVLLLVVLVTSYRQVIEAFPNGGGAYAVATRHLGQLPALTAAGSLVVDYVLNAAVGVSAGVAALTSAFPGLFRYTVILCLVVLAAITAANLWGVAESARLFIVPTLIFIAAIALVIFSGLIRSHPVVTPPRHLPSVAESVGVLLLLRAFASGCSALTGVEAIANAVPSFRKPRIKHAQHTEIWLGALLGAMLIGLAILIRKYHVTPDPQETVLAQLAAIGVGKGILFYGIQLITTVLLALAANTSFGGLPVLASLLARDNFLPHLFFLKADRQVHRYGVVVLAVFAAVLLVVANGNTQRLVPLFAIGVFVGFTLSQTGMVRHWREQRGPGWAVRATINGVGAVMTLAALAVELISKFTEGAWLVVITVPLLVLMFSRIHAIYARIGTLLRIGEIPPAPEREHSLVIVPVSGMSRLTQEGVSAALSLGEEVIAVTVSYTEPADEESHDKLREQWEQWNPGVPLVSLRTTHRSLAPPIVDYLRELEADDRYGRIVVLIPEVQPARPWQRILHNQRGFVLDQAIQKGTTDVVICRLHFQLTTWTQPAAGAPVPPPASPGHV
ncbi:MAG TPA: APC family permease [Streptosporangiaceae bacterium]|jgi:amino acid transporter|nr:APC family permease [Streptosporangiaceae bacterium]